MYSSLWISAKLVGAILSTLLIVVIAGVLCFGCAANGKLATRPADVDWTKTSQFYHTYITDVAEPLGGMAAAVLVPGCGDLIAKADAASNKLDDLLAAKASGAKLADQVVRVQAIIEDINQAIGSKKVD